jgi:hypothetical protein
MYNLTDWGEVFTASFTELWFEFVNLIPNLIGALIILIVGFLVAKSLGRLVGRLLNRIYLDKAVETIGLKKILNKAGFNLLVSQALGLLITWFLYAVVLVAAADILGLNQISVFLSDVVLYIPNVIIAVVILLVGIIVSNFFFTLVKEMSLAAGLKASDFLAGVAKWAILVFTFMAALIQLKVATELIQILFTGLVFMLALAGGIAFGLGGKDKAREVIDKLIQK